MSRFKDILSERRSQNDLSWISRSFRPKSTNCNRSTCVDPVSYRFKVLINKDIYNLMNEVYEYESTSQHFFRINEMVNEMGCLKSIIVVRSLGLVLLKIMKRILQSVLVNESKLFEIRSRMGKNPVVFVPTHRSYADFILMAFLCFAYDIEIPVVVAGMDFHDMFGMATLLRQCGAMYMRRSFRDDKVYSCVLKKYIQTVISEGNSPFEFFIEGARSRCGKSLMPKLGLLKMIVEVYLKKEVTDVTFVPLSISYDRFIEDNLFARELLGVPKPKESTRGLLKGISLLEQQYGNICVNVGNELSLKEFLNENPAENFLPRLAQTIVIKQQENIVIGYFNMLSIVIIGKLMSNKQQRIPLSVILSDVNKIRNALLVSGAHIHAGNDKFEIERCLAIHKFLSQNPIDGSIYLNNITDDIPTTATTFLILQHYSNSCYYFLVSSAILIIILRIEKILQKNSLFIKYKMFRDLFKHDFLFFDFTVQSDLDKACQVLEELKLVQWHNSSMQLIESACLDELWINLMFPYLQGYLFVCQCLIQLGSKGISRSQVVIRIRKQIELELEISDGACLFYTLSSHFLSCTLSSLTDLEILHSNASDYLFVRNPEKLMDIISFLGNLVQRSDCNRELPNIPVTSKL